MLSVLEAAREKTEGRRSSKKPERSKPHGPLEMEEPMAQGEKAFEDDDSDGGEPRTLKEWREALALARSREATAKLREKNMATELAVVRNQLYEAKEACDQAKGKIAMLERQVALQSQTAKGRSGSDIFYAQPSPTAACGMIPGLEELFRVSGCQAFLPAAERWCHANGCTSAADLSDPIFAGIVT